MAQDDLQILITAALDLKKSLETMKSQVSALQNGLKGQKIELEADLSSGAKQNIQQSLDQFANIKIDGSGIKQAGSAIDSMGKKTASTAANFTLVNQAINGLERAGRNMVSTAANLDKQLVDLRMVTGGSYDDVSRLVDSYNVLAKELGTSTGQVLDASSEWLRQGKSVAETQELIRQSMILSKVGNMDASTATQRLTSTMKGYDVAVSDVAGVVDKLTAVDMAAAVSADGLAEALSHTANSASLAGVSLDKIIAYLTVVQETTQKSSSVVGESFKSMFARMQKVVNGDAVDDYGQDISQVESTLRSLGIELRASETEFRSMGDVLDEIGAKFNNLDSVTQRQIVTAMGGVYQSENLLALLKNYDKVADYVDIAANAAGTAEQKFAAYQEGIESHYNTLIASAEALAKQTVPAEFLNGLMDAGSAILDFVAQTDLLTVALASLGSAFAVKGISAFANTLQETYSKVSHLSEAFDILGQAADVTLSADQFEQLLQATSGLDAAQLKLVVSSQALTNEQRIALLTASGLTAEEAAQQVATTGLAAAEGTATAATFSLSGAFHALTAAIAANPFGFLIVALTTTITVISTASNKIRQEHEAMIQGLKDDADELTDTLEDLEGQYDSNLEKIKELYALKADGGLTGDEQQELESLQAQNEQLALQIQYYKDLSAAKHEEAAAAIAAELRDKKYTQSFYENNDPYIEHGEGQSRRQLGTEELLQRGADALRDYAEQYRELRQQRIDGEIDEATYLARVTALEDKRNNVLRQTSDAVTDVNDNLKYLSEADAGKYTSLINELQEASAGFTEALSEGYSEAYSARIDKVADDASAKLQEKLDKAREQIRAFQEDFAKTHPGMNPEAAPIPEEWLDNLNAYGEAIKRLESAPSLSDLLFLGEKANTGEISLAEYREQLSSFSAALNELKDYGLDEETVMSIRILIDTIEVPDVGEVATKISSQLAHNVPIKANELLPDIKDKLTELFPTAPELEEFTQWYNQYELTATETFDTVLAAWQEHQAEIAAAMERDIPDSADKMRKSLEKLWDSEDFAASKSNLEEMAETLDGITPDAIETLAESSEELSAVLQQDGMDAQFLAHVLQSVASGGAGFDLITEEALQLNSALTGLTSRFDEVTAALQRYKDATGAPEYDTEFQGYAAAYKSLQDQIEKGRTGSREFWAGAELFLGSERLDEFGWDEGIDNIIAALNKLEPIFADAESAGAGLAQQLYNISEAEGLVNENGEKLVELNSDGSFTFNFEESDITHFAEALGMEEEALLACYKAWQVYGSIDFSDTAGVIDSIKEIGIATETSNEQTAINANALKEHLKDLGKSGKEIHDITSALQEVDGVVLVDVTGEVNDFKNSLVELGTATEGTDGITVDIEKTAELLSQLGASQGDVEGAIEALSALEGLSFVDSEGNLISMKEALEALQGFDFSETADGMSDVGDSASDAANEMRNLADATNEANSQTLSNINEQLESVASAASETNESVDFKYATDEVENLKQSLEELGAVADDGVEITVDVDKVAEVLSQLNFNPEQIQVAIQALSQLNNVTFTDAQGSALELNEALEKVGSHDFNQTQGGLDAVSNKEEQASQKANQLASSLQQVNNVNLSHVSSQLDAVAAAASQAAHAVDKVRSALISLNGTTASVNINVNQSGGGGGNKPQAMATGTKYAHGGPALLGDEYSPSGKPKPELVVSKDEAYIAGQTGPEMVNLQKGDRVFTADETKEILRGTNGKKVFPAFAGGVHGTLNFGKKITLSSGSSSGGSKSGGSSSAAQEEAPVVQATASTIEIDQAVLQMANPLEVQANLQKANEEYMRQFGGGGGADGETQFEKDYKKWKHDLDMDLITTKDFFEWLDQAYQEAFETGMIEVDDAAKYQLEVWEKRKDWMKEVRQERENAISEAEHWRDDAIDSFKINEYNWLFDRVAEHYHDTIEAAEKLGVDLNRTIYGNIDLNNQLLPDWTPENVYKFTDALESWGVMATQVDDIMSGIYGTMDTFDGQDIAFTPILQTEDGPVLLDSDTVHNYIYGLIEKAGEGWTPEQLMILDTEGIEKDGVLVKNLLAEIGESAAFVSEAMHFGGENGAVSQAFASIKEIVGDSDYALEKFLEAPGNFTNIEKYTAWITSYYDELIDIVDKQEQEFKDRVDEEGNRLYSDTSDEITELQDLRAEYQKNKIEAVADAYEALEKHAKNAITLNENWLDNAITDGSVGNVRKYADNISEYYQQMQERIHDLADFYRSQGYSDTSDEVSKLSDLWWEYEQKRIDVAADAWAEIVDISNKAVDDIQNVYKTLHDAADEYAQSGGYLSIDTLQAINDLGPQYMQYLKDENGMLVINEENIRKVIAAKTEQLAIDSSMAYVERLRLALNNQNQQELEQLLYATQGATDATWGLVYSELALLNLSDEQYEAALHNINAIRSLATAAIDGIGHESDELSSALNKMKSGLDDLLKYIMDMLEQRVEDQIDALEDMKDAYSDIVDKQKESLKAAKDSLSYNKNIASKMKEMAKLQAQIDALSLDSSREAQAKRAKLVEELADLQDDLSESQADHMQKAQEDALDKMEKDYHAEKDSEIEKLEESISSTEKLYRMAMDYLENDIGTDYERLKNELCEWNYEVGNSFESEIVSAWEDAIAAAERYGSLVEGIKMLPSDIESLESSSSWSSYSSGGNGDEYKAGTNLTVGRYETYDGEAEITKDVVTIATRMKERSAEWGKYEGDPDAQAELHKENISDAAIIQDLLRKEVYFDPNDYRWHVRGEGDLYKLYAGKYHKGGIIGGGSLKENEKLAVLEDDEWVLNGEKIGNLIKQMEVIDKLSAAFRDMPLLVDNPLQMKDIFRGDTISNSSMINNNQPVTVNYNGDTIINGPSNQTVAKHQEISRKMADQVFSYLHLKK